MKKILILETAAFKGGYFGGSFQQASYYGHVLKKKGYRVEVFKGKPGENKFSKAYKVIKKIKNSDYVIGFGTLLLGFYLQWTCFILGKKGIFCIDTILKPISIIHDHFKRKIYFDKINFSFLFKKFYDQSIIRLVPPKLNLFNLASCEYVEKRISNTPFKSGCNKYAIPRVILEKREKYESSKDKIVLYYGHLYRGRGVIDVLKACRILWEKGYNFKFVILGWPVDQLTKKRLLHKLSREGSDNIILKGRVNDLRYYLIRATVVAIPFRYECSFQPPYTILEPMGAYVPVVTTAVGANPYWIKHEETGLICQRENIQDLADKIEMVFNNKKLVKKITLGAYNLLEKCYAEGDILLDTLEKLNKRII